MKINIQKHLTLPRVYLFYQLLRQGTMLLLAILLAKSQLGTLSIGQYEQVWFMGGALSFFWMIGLQQGLLNQYPRLPAVEQASLLSTAVAVYFAISAILVGAIVWLPGVVLPLFSGQASLPFFQVSAWFLLLYLPTLLTDTLYVLLNRPMELLVYGLLSFGLQLLLVLWPAYAGGGAASIVLGLMGLSAAKALWLLGLAWRFGNLRWTWAQLRGWWDASFYLMVYSAIGGYITVFNAWMVNWQYAGDERQFALFRYGARELPISLALVSGLNALFLQKVAENVQLALPDIRLRSTRLMHFLMPFTLVLMLTSRWWFVALFSREFMASLPVFNTFLLLVISRVIFSFPVLNGLQDKRIALIAACSEALFNVVLCFILVPYWGLLGIALANFFAYGLEKVIYSIRLQRRHQVPVSAYLNVPVWALYTLLLILAWAAQIFWL